MTSCCVKRRDSVIGMPAVLFDSFVSYCKISKEFKLDLISVIHANQSIYAKNTYNILSPI